MVVFNLVAHIPRVAGVLEIVFFGSLGNIHSIIFHSGIYFRHHFFTILS